MIFNDFPKSSKNETFDQYFENNIKSNPQFSSFYEENLKKYKKSSRNTLYFLSLLIIICFAIFSVRQLENEFPLGIKIFTGIIMSLPLTIIFAILFFIFRPNPAKKLIPFIQAYLLPKLLAFFDQNLTFITNPENSYFEESLEVFDILKPAEGKVLVPNYFIKGQFQEKNINIAKLLINDKSANGFNGLYSGYIMTIEAKNNFINGKIFITQNSSQDFDIYYEDENEISKNFITESNLVEYLRSLYQTIDTPLTCIIIDNKLMISILNNENLKNDIFRINELNIKKSYFYNDSLRLASVIWSFLSFAKISKFVKENAVSTTPLKTETVENKISAPIKNEPYKPITMEGFDEYYEKFIKPSNEEITNYQENFRKVKSKIKFRAFLTSCLLIFIYLIYGNDIIDSIKQMFETSAKNTQHPTFDKFLGIATLTFLSGIVIFLLLIFIFLPLGKFTEGLQNNLLPKIIKFFGENLIFNPAESDNVFTKNLLSNFGLKEQDKFDSFFYGDEDWNIDEDYSIKGVLNNKQINILKVGLSKGRGKRKKEIFEGILLFNDKTLINSLDKIIIKQSKDINSKEDIDQQDIKKLFTIICHNETDNNLINEIFLKYLISLSNQFNAKIECRIYKDKMLILIKCSDPFAFSSSAIKEQPPFYQSSKKRVKEIEMLLLAFSF